MLDRPSFVEGFQKQMTVKWRWITLQKGLKLTVHFLLEIKPCRWLILIIIDLVPTHVRFYSNRLIRLDRRFVTFRNDPQWKSTNFYARVKPFRCLWLDVGFTGHWEVFYWNIFLGKTDDWTDICEYVYRIVFDE